jgi:hypothetical protein
MIIAQMLPLFSVLSLTHEWSHTDVRSLKKKRSSAFASWDVVLNVDLPWGVSWRIRSGLHVAQPDSRTARRTINRR